MHVCDNKLYEDFGEFSSHWAACAAMIRSSDPDFKSLGGDKPEDLAIERELRAQVRLRAGVVLWDEG